MWAISHYHHLNEYFDKNATKCVTNSRNMWIQNAKVLREIHLLDYSWSFSILAIFIKAKGALRKIWLWSSLALNKSLKFFSVKIFWTLQKILKLGPHYYGGIRLWISFLWFQFGASTLLKYFVHVHLCPAEKDLNF